jgi:hypothetical protein
MKENLIATLPSRECTSRWDGLHYPSEPLAAEYEPHEEEVVRGLMKLAREHPKGSEEYERLLSEVRLIHEAKALLGARVLTDEERRAVTDEEAAQTDAFAEAQAHNEAHPKFAIPAKAMKEIGEGQTTLIPPEGTTPLPMPSLPNPDENRIGKFHGPDSGAPRTEREAAILAYPNSGTARRRVLDHIAASASGATDEEISLALDMRLYTAAPRRNELLNDGWICDSGKTRPTTTGTRAVVWVLTQKGREQWRSAA